MAVTPTAVLKDEQQSFIQFLMLENVSGSEIHRRISVVYGVYNVITKSTVNQLVQRFKAGQTSTSDNPQSDRLSKRKTGVIFNKLINR